MKKSYQILLTGSVVILFGALLSFILHSKTDQLFYRILIGYFYAIAIFAALAIVQWIIIPKISIFSTIQQWILRSLLYAMAITGAYIAGYIFQTIILLPGSQLQDLIAEQLLTGFLSLITKPFSQNPSNPLFTKDFQIMVVGFFSVIFIIGLLSVVGSYIEVRWREVRQQQALQQAELMALRAQIEPHFLFNSLNTIISLVRNDPATAERLLLQLSHILRYLSQQAPREMVPLEKEVEFTEQYVSLLQARFGDRLRVQWQVDMLHPEIRVPVLLMQPLIENAVQHGWKNREQPLHLSIQISENEKEIFLQIKDDGAGIQPARLKQLPSEGHALANIADRLRIRYGHFDCLGIHSEPGRGTTVKIKIPVKKK